MLLSLPVAATAIKMNAALNSVNIDVCTKNLVGDSCDKWNCILLGDMVYDAVFTEQLLKWLKAIRSHRKLVLLGDPGRHALKDSTDNCFTQVATYCLPENACLENRGFTHACVWMFM
jgi:predicted nicotinamide N-methyase